MDVKRVKKKLSLKRLTVEVLKYIKASDLKKDELKDVKAGDEDITVGLGVTGHPKYC